MAQAQAAYTMLLILINSLDDNKVGIDGHEAIYKMSLNCLDNVPLWEGVSCGLLNMFAATKWNSSKMSQPLSEVNHIKNE